VNDLKEKHTALVNQNGMIQADIKRKSTRSRIAVLATEQLGMVDPSEPPGGLKWTNRNWKTSIDETVRTKIK